MANHIPELTTISQAEWEERFEELGKQVSTKEIYAQIWFPNGLLRSIVSRLWVDELWTHLHLSQAKHHDKFCAEIAIENPEPMSRQYQMCEVGDGQVFLWMQQEHATLELSNSLELLEILTTDAPLQ